MCSNECLIPGSHLLMERILVLDAIAKIIYFARLLVFDYNFYAWKRLNEVYVFQVYVFECQVDTERLQSERKFYGELQQMEGDFRSGGQRGMNPHKKKKPKR